jgi:hypothetical protein
LRKALYAAAIAIVLAALIIGTRTTSAQVPSQGGGGFIQGYVYGFDMYDKLQPLAWVQVTASNANYKFVASTGGGGDYGMFVPPGAYNLSVSAPGYTPYSRSVFIGEGSATDINVYLYESGVPVPEFPTQTIAMVIVFAVSGLLLAKRTRKHKR